MTQSAITSQALNTVPDDWQETVQNACELVAPVWPLDQWIAVNPFWGLRHLPAAWADSLLQQRGGFSILPPASFYQSAWANGRIQRKDLDASLQELESSDDADALIRWLTSTDTRRATGATGARSVLSCFPATPDGERLTDVVADQVARACAAFFDQRQSRWSAAEPSESLYQFWLDTSKAELSLEAVTGLPGIRGGLKALPADVDEASEAAIRKLGIGGEALTDLVHGWLLALNGWASWCRGEDWRADLANQPSTRLRELVAVVLSWEAAALECASVDQKAEWIRKRDRKGKVAQPSPRAWLWHRAYEIGFQRQLWQSLGKTEQGQSGMPAPTEISAQAVFCIDVRSEVLRRHLEHADPSVQTLGFAGFFGLPIEHQALAPVESVRQLPGLLNAPYRLVDSQGSLKADFEVQRHRDQKEIARGSVRSAKYSSLSTFTLVETTGLAWAWKLIKDSLKKPVTNESSEVPERRLVHKVGGDPLSDKEKAEIVANMLRGMSLTRLFAPLVVFVGHGSRTNNNPHHAGLQCGACGGQSGAVNARLAASLFNDPGVRIQLAEQEGIRIPDYSWAVAAEHCTLTDEVHLLDETLVPDTHLPRLSQLRRAFAQAGSESRRERSTSLGLVDQSDEQLAHRMTKRGDDWAEVRPEWGLANNGAIIFAKRERTRGADFGGRVFLHDYDPALDDSGAILEALMTAPMVVANWINLQYFASVSTPDVFGAGNKLLHSVVGGNVGVIEGNSPQLRIGLPWQSVHDGRQWRHEPVRLTVLIDAPAARIESVIHKHKVLAELVENQWVSLCRFSAHGPLRYRDGEWVPAAGQG